MLNKPEQRDILSKDEIENEIRKLSPSTLLRLADAARWLSGREHCSDDLLQEAILRLLDGTRTWKRGMKAEPHLYSMMRSIAHANFKRKTVEKGAMSIIDDRAEEDEDASRVGGDKVAPDDSLINSEAEEMAKSALEKIMNALGDDTVAQEVLYGQMEEKPVDQVCQELGITRTQYDTKRKKIWRLLQDKFPKDWRKL